MKCGKCGHDNLKAIEFCVRCHYPLRFTCPACKQEQSHGGQCDHCGADFAKYAAMLLAQAQSQAEQRREAAAGRHSAWKQVLLAIFTLGLSLIFYHRSRVLDK
jgi:predicted amidophosphoribosyltransferase